MHRPSASIVLASAALFVALGGTAEAARLINGNTIKAGTITSKQVKAKSLALSDLSASTRRSLTATAAGSVGAAQLAPNAVTGAAIADGSVSASDLLPNAIGSSGIIDGGVGTADVADGAVTRGKVAADAIDAARVADGSLGGRDIGTFAGQLAELDYGTIPGGTCKAVTSTGLTPVAGTQSLLDDAIVVTPGASFPSTGLALFAKPASASQVSVTVCNLTGSDVVLGTRSFRYVSVDVG